MISLTRPRFRQFAAADDYDCVPLPVPVDGGAKQLQGMDKMALQDLGQDFREEFLLLERRILERLRRPRVLGGTTVTGPMLADMLETFTAAVQRQDGAMADIAQLPTQREMLVTLAGDRAVKAGVAHYRASMQELFHNRAQESGAASVGGGGPGTMQAAATRSRAVISRTAVTTPTKSCQ